jgi:hypothetical protein
LKGFLKLFIKIAVTGVCLWYVGQKIDWQATWNLLLKAQKGWLLLAALFFTLSKLLAAFRLALFFRCIGLRIGHRANVGLYWLGMFYNLFLPGGIGGDAYKGILLTRHFSTISGKKIAAAILLDRISGVVGLGLLAAVCWFVIFRQSWYGWVVIAGLPVGLLIYRLVYFKWFPSFIQAFYSTLFGGLGVQLLQVLCIWMVMLSIGIQQSQLAFQLLFLLSSIVAILPFTIGGLGAREVVFLWGAQTFGLLPTEAVFISLLFYLITVLVSLAGVWWVFRPVKLRENEAQNL